MPVWIDAFMTALYNYSRTGVVHWKENPTPYCHFIRYPLSSCVLVGRIRIAPILAALDACHKVPKRCQTMQIISICKLVRSPP
ncbi:hypothetical protein EYC80_001776 [Monilinia laxa]|uniref:Uncharacterized protein n=1 Tax=Monilinia laxa TaxID=61186 RepID=A0A5N6K600_MONLA|nr:hypothetical protein EYC80_001776 [Monilinia laxa]